MTPLRIDPSTGRTNRIGGVGSNDIIPLRYRPHHRPAVRIGNVRYQAESEPRNPISHHNYHYRTQTIRLDWPIPGQLPQIGQGLLESKLSPSDDALAIAIASCYIDPER